MGLFDKKKKEQSARDAKDTDRVKHKLCPNCGCDLTGQHWFRCPRCQQELDAGCSGCGACNG